MANVTGKVVSVAIDVPVKKKDGGTYQGWKLVYEDADGDVKTIAKHMNSLKYAQPLKNGLENLKPGDNFVLEQEKEGDFWNPKSVYKSMEGSAPKGDTSGNSKQSTTRSFASATSITYPTVEERAQTQKYIVRQSSLTNALKLLELQGNKKADVGDVIDYAVLFENFVMGNTPQKNAVAKTGAANSSDNPFEDMEDDVPL